jgi:hypothetical protein
MRFSFYPSFVDGLSMIFHCGIGSYQSEDAAHIGQRPTGTRSLPRSSSRLFSRAMRFSGLPVANRRSICLC